MIKILKNCVLIGDEEKILIKCCYFNKNIDVFQTKGEDALKATDADTIKNLISDEESTIELELIDKSYSHTNVTFNIG